MTLGIFEVEHVTPGVWKVTNTLTSAVHRTFGRHTDVFPRLERQSAEFLSRREEGGGIIRHPSMKRHVMSSGRRRGERSQALLELLRDKGPMHSREILERLGVLHDVEGTRSVQATLHTFKVQGLLAQDGRGHPYRFVRMKKAV